jgi:hypothetical protein
MRKLTKKPKQREPKTIRAINWSRALYLEGGGYAAIFKVGSNTVAKVGVVDEMEAELQRAYAQLEAALPVLDYKPGLILPRRIRRKACPCHGPRKEIVACGENCACESELDVLLMPLADMNITLEEATDLMALMSELQQERPEHRPWDDRMSNCAKYQGKAVALDFGSAQ